MTKFNTGNPVGSADPRDLYDTATVADNLVNGDQAAYNDRLGRSRRSWQSVEDQVNQQEVEFNTAQDDREGVFNSYLVSAGYQSAGDYAAGIEITQYNQVVRDASGEFWRVSGSVTLPYTTTGAGLPEGGNFVAVGDAALRQELALPVSAGNGAALVNGATIYVGSVAKLEALSLAVGVHVYLTQDGRAGDFVVKAGTPPSDPQKGVYIVLANGNYAERVYKGAINVLWFGAVGDKVTDDYAAIQGAFNFVSDGGSVYFPKLPTGAAQPSYYISQGLSITANDVSIYSDLNAEYSEGIQTDQAIDIITCSGYGLHMQYFNLFGNGTADTFATTSGLVLDRSPKGDSEINSNLDAYIDNCCFFRLKDCIRGVGRNVFVFDNIFTESKRGVVGELFTYNAGVDTADFRGWRVSRNRFHSIGSQYNRATTTEAVPTSVTNLDSWCIQMPQTTDKTSHLEIFDNNTDFCGAGFYKGYLAGAKIKGNQTHISNPTFVYANIVDPANQIVSSNYHQVIEDNSLNGRLVTSVASTGSGVSTNTIVATGVSNLTIQNNVARNSFQQHCVINSCTRLRMMNNNWYNANTQFLDDSTLRSAIIINDSANARVNDNEILNTITAGVIYEFGIKTSNATAIKLRDNTITGANSRYSIPATNVFGAGDDGLDWQTPTMENSFTLAANSKGYRKMMNGMVQISVEVSNGTDNTRAFLLPAGYRPPSNINISGVGTFASAYALINTNGEVIINWDEATPPSFSSINIFFEAA